jgi:hypothetical protein
MHCFEIRRLLPAFDVAVTLEIELNKLADLHLKIHIAEE